MLINEIDGSRDEVRACVRACVYRASDHIFPALQSRFFSVYRAIPVTIPPHVFFLYSCRVFSVYVVFPCTLFC